MLSLIQRKSIGPNHGLATRGGPEASSASFAFGQLENEKQLLVPYKSFQSRRFCIPPPPDPIRISLSGCISAER